MLRLMTLSATCWFVVLAPAAAAQGDSEVVQPLRVLTGHKQFVNSMAFSSDGKLLATASDDATVIIWDTSSGREVRRLTKHRLEVLCVVFTPNDQELAAGDLDGWVYLWDVATGKVIRRIRATSGTVDDLAVSPDGKYTAMVDGITDTVRVWETRSGKLIHESADPGACDRVWFSQDGRHMVRVGKEGLLKVLDTSTWGRERELKDLGFLNGISLAPDGRRLLAGDAGSGFRLLELETGHEVRALRGHRGVVFASAFSPDGRFAVSASGGLYQGGNDDVKLITDASPLADNTLRIWRLATGEQLQEVRGHTRGIHCVALSSDGRYLASGSRDGMVRLWRLELPEQ